MKTEISKSQKHEKVTGERKGIHLAIGDMLTVTVGDTLVDFYVDDVCLVEGFFGVKHATVSTRTRKVEK